MDDKFDLFDITEDDSSSTQEEVFDLNSYSTTTVVKKKKKKRSVLKILLIIFLAGVIFCGTIVGGLAVFIFTSVDSTMDVDLNDLQLNYTTTIYVKGEDGEYEEYQRLHGMNNRIWVSYDRESATTGDESYTGIPQNLVNAFVAIEDKRFYNHNGTDWKRTISAFGNMFLHYYSSNQGGSTITQQLVKNLTGDSEQNASRKIREIMRARYLEEHYTKDVIVECYLNTAAMGHGTYGVEVAANYYFDKSVNELTLLECASLAAITKSPTYNAPDTYPENNETRRNAVLKEMLSQGYITEDEYNEAMAQELNIVANSESLKEIEINNYFVDALIDQVVDDLVKQYGYDENVAENLFYSSGYKIYATMDKNIQSIMESVFSNSEKYGLKGNNGETMQASMTIVDYEGNVVGIVGGIGEKTVNRGFNRATSAARQPGSTIKPLSAYCLAIENDLITYSTLVNDKKTTYNKWTPVNWYGYYAGNITVEKALERSVNTIPVYLVNELGPQTSYDFLTQKLCFKQLTEYDVNLSPMGMGGTNGGVSTLESASAFAIFGNGGYYYTPHFYTKITDKNGDVVLSYENTKPTMAITEDTATVMNHLLQNVVYGSQGTGRTASAYVTNMKFYAKTGTSNSQNDLWFVGGTPYYVGSCWSGFDSQQRVSDSKIALKLWGEVMKQVHKNLKSISFTDSTYVEARYYCTSTGMLATEECTSKKIGWYKKSHLPGVCEHGESALSALTSEDIKNYNKKETSSEDSSSGSTTSSKTSSTTSSTTSSSSSKAESTQNTSSQNSSSTVSQSTSSEVTSSETTQSEGSSSAESVSAEQ